jgi:hypothetical protein
MDKKCRGNLGRDNSRRLNTGVEIIDNRGGIVERGINRERDNRGNII